MRSCRAVLVVVALVGLTAPPLLATPTALQGALDLYAAASYEEALAALDTVAAADLTVDDQVVVAQHRMLCLMAMGRTAEAERAAASLLALRPEFLLGAREASPRVRTMFDTARRRVLPVVVRERFTAARRLYDGGALAEARTLFSSVTAALGDAALVERDPALADLRTLADGFLALTTAAGPRGAAAVAPSAAATPPPLATDAERAVAPMPVASAVPPAPPPPTLIVDESSTLVSFPSDSAAAWHEGDVPTDRSDETPEVATVVTPRSASEAVPDAAPDAPRPAPVPGTPAPVSPAAVPAESAPAPAAADTPVPAPPVVAPAGAPFTPIDIFTYDWRDKDVTPPVPVAQAVSGWWGGMGEPPAGTPLGAVELVIDEHGKVADAKIYLSVNRVYDAVLLASVGQWRYQPATRGGRPVKYRRISGVVSGR